MIRSNYFILTGAYGSGKSTILKELRALGVQVIEEPARQILFEQRAIGGEGVGDRDPRLFVELMLSRSINSFRQADPSADLIVFDRGVPDNIAYAGCMGLELEHTWNAAWEFRCNPVAFLTPPWEQIYECDDERTASFEMSCDFDRLIRNAYAKLGYTLVEVPCEAPPQRATFILDRIREIKR